MVHLKVFSIKLSIDFIHFAYAAHLIKTRMLWKAVNFVEFYSLLFNLDVPLVKIEMASRAFSVAEPVGLKQSGTVTQFRRLLKTFLFE